MALSTAGLLDIPAPLWAATGLALVALVERIATMPARIARKREQELLKRTIARKQIQLVIEGPADIVLRLSVQQDPLPRESLNEVGFDSGNARHASTPVGETTGSTQS